MMTNLPFRPTIIAIAVGASVGAILLVIAFIFGLKRCRRVATPTNSTAQMVENSSSGQTSIANPQFPHPSSFADPQMSHSPRLPSPTVSQSPHRIYHPTFADHPLAPSPHPSQSFGSGASSPMYHSPNTLLGGNSPYPTAPSSPDFLNPVPSNGYYNHALLPPQHDSRYEAMQAPVPSNYAWTPGNAGIESRDFGQSLYRHYSPQFGGPVTSPMTGMQDGPNSNTSQYPVR